MVRLWLTDEQANIVRCALNDQVKRLCICVDEIRNNSSYEIDEKYIKEANVLKDVVAVLDYSMRK